MDKTETKEMEGEKCDCGGSIIMFNADIDTCNKCWKQYDPRPKRDLLKENQSLRSELQKAKEDNQLTQERIDKCMGIADLRERLEKAKELNGELVKLLKRASNYMSFNVDVAEDLKSEILSAVKKSEI